MSAHPVDAAACAAIAAVLAMPHMAPLFAAAFVGRLPVGMYSLAIVLFVSKADRLVRGRRRGDRRVQAIASGCLGAVLGRLIDRVGPDAGAGRPARSASRLSVAALIVVAEATPRAGPVLACAVACGAHVPAAVRHAAHAARASWQARLAETAFALEAIAAGAVLHHRAAAGRTDRRGRHRAGRARLVAAAWSRAGPSRSRRRTPSRRWRRDGGEAAPGALCTSPGIRTIAAGERHRRRDVRHRSRWRCRPSPASTARPARPA